MNVVLLVGIGFAGGVLTFPLITGILIWAAARADRRSCGPFWADPSPTRAASSSVLIKRKPSSDPAVTIIQDVADVVDHRRRPRDRGRWRDARVIGLATARTGGAAGMNSG